MTIYAYREGLKFFDPTSDPLGKELSKGKFTILPSKVRFFILKMNKFYKSFLLELTNSIDIGKKEYIKEDF